MEKPGSQIRERENSLVPVKLFYSFNSEVMEKWGSLFTSTLLVWLSSRSYFHLLKSATDKFHYSKRNAIYSSWWIEHFQIIRAVVCTCKKPAASIHVITVNSCSVVHQVLQKIEKPWLMITGNRTIYYWKLWKCRKGIWIMFNCACIQEHSIQAIYTLLGSEVL